MKTDLADISKVFQDYVSGGRPASGVSCPTPERLARCVMEKVSRKERDEVVGHAANCVACAAALKQLLALSAETDRVAAEIEACYGYAEPGRSEAKRSFWTRPVIKPAVAVLAGILLVAVLIESIPKLLNRSGTRGGTEARIALVSPVKGESIGDGLEFKWQGLAGAEHYSVEVFDKALKLVWRSGRAAGTEIRLPAEARGKLTPGETYYWMVTAITAGRAETKSTLAEFSVPK
jgi:hypothetical protein